MPKSQRKSLFHPVHDEFMDQDMRNFWTSLEPLPGELRLYGGTALALFLNHRQSTDFGFATPLPVVGLDFVAGLPGVMAAQLSGGDGMVDGVVKSRDRDIRLTFMECRSLLPLPAYRPIEAENGVLVAHPADLIASKAHAICSRGALRDYQDLAASFRAWSELCVDTLRSAPSRSCLEIARALNTPPIDSYQQLERDQLSLLASLAQRVMGNR